MKLYCADGRVRLLPNRNFGKSAIRQVGKWRIGSVGARLNGRDEGRGPWDEGKKPLSGMKPDTTIIFVNHQSL